MKLTPLVLVGSILNPKSGAIASALVDGDDVRLVEVVARDADVREDEARDVLRVLGVIR